MTKHTHQTTAGNAKVAAFQHLWNVLIENFRKKYSVGEYMTIDEQLILFRGGCSWWQYMPKKPVKYEIKLFHMCDVAVAYTFSGMPYVCCEGGQWRTGLAQNGVNPLVGQVHNLGINVTRYNWFTGSELAAHLLHKKKITVRNTVLKQA